MNALVYFTRYQPQLAAPLLARGALLKMVIIPIWQLKKGEEGTDA